MINDIVSRFRKMDNKLEASENDDQLIELHRAGKLQRSPKTITEHHQCNPGSGKKVTLTKLRREDSVRRGERAPTLRCIQRQRQRQIKRHIRRQRHCSERGKSFNILRC